jgi:hypothetical protein
MKKKSAVKDASGMKLVLITILLALAAQIATAEERKGIIRGVEEISIVGSGRRLALNIDTTGNRIADAFLIFPSPVLSVFSKNLQEFVERGMEIIFDDEGHIALRSGGIQVNGDNTISIDGVNMLDLFPNETARFKFAAAARQRAQTQATQSPPTPATQETAEERRIRELEEELRRLREGR